MVQEEKAELDTLFTLSKNGKNVVILMMDRLIGGYVPKALEFIPELKQKYDGFNWKAFTTNDDPVLLLQEGKRSFFQKSFDEVAGFTLLTSVGTGGE